MNQTPTVAPSPPDSAAIRSLRSEYSITSQEEDWIVGESSPDVSSVQKAEVLLARLAEWVDCDRTLNHFILRDHVKTSVSLATLSLQSREEKRLVRF